MACGHSALDYLAVFAEEVLADKACFLPQSHNKWIE